MSPCAHVFCRHFKIEKTLTDKISATKPCVQRLILWTYPDNMSSSKTKSRILTITFYPAICHHQSVGATHSQPNNAISCNSTIKEDPVPIIKSPSAKGSQTSFTSAKSRCSFVTTLYFHFSKPIAGLCLVCLFFLNLLYMNKVDLIFITLFA